MDSASLDLHARALGSLLLSKGPIPRAKVLAILRQLTLSEEAAGEVLAYALANGFVEALGKDDPAVSDG